MILKVIGYTIAEISAGSFLSDTFARKVDRNLVRPVRNYRLSLHDYGNWRTSEDFVFFLSEAKTGIFRMFKYESDA